MSTPDDIAFLAQFENGMWPYEDWHHRQHIKAAYLYLRRYEFTEAVARMCERIKAYNAANSVPEGPLQGYHETLTQAWMRLVYFTLCEYGPGETADESTTDAFYDRHPQLHSTKVLRLFYSPACLTSAEAKATYVEPDLAQFPVSKKSTAFNVTSV